MKKSHGKVKTLEYMKTLTRVEGNNVLVSSCHETFHELPVAPNHTFSHAHDDLLVFKLLPSVTKHKVKPFK